MTPDYLYISRFPLRAGGHGGNRRVRQIHEALAGTGLRFLDIAQIAADGAPETQSPLFSRCPEFDRRYRFNAHLRGQFARDFNLAREIGAYDLSGVLIDDPVFFPHTTRELARRKIPFAAVVHNLESLALLPKDPGHQQALLREEVDLLSMAGLSITISREETWLLRNFGLPCCDYPYHPTRDVAAGLAAVRQARENTPKQYFLCLGTAFNPATYEGMLELATIWRELSSGKEVLVMAGYGTELVKQAAGRLDGVVVAGAVGADKLQELMASCRACIVHQRSGSGALTKIPELLLAGVPVIASRHAARSYVGLPGIRVYDRLAELPDLLSAVEAAPSQPEGASGRDDALRAAVMRLFAGAQGT